MTGPTCMTCNAPTDNTPFCDRCEPTTCYWCSASHVHYDSTHVYCSHGCEHTLAEHSHHQFYTVLLNGTPAETLSYGGPHIELIIPNGTPVTVHDSIPDADSVPDTHVLATHYTTQKRTVLTDGIQYPPHEHSEARADWSHGTIREHAVYAWPYTPAFTESELSWSEADANDPVILSVPEDTVRASSYDFLWCLEVEDSPFWIPYEKYEQDLTFHPSAVHDAAEQFAQPCLPDELLLYHHREP